MGRYCASRDEPDLGGLQDPSKPPRQINNLRSIGNSAARHRAGTARARPEGGSLSQLFGRAKYKNRNSHGNPDANTKTCPDSNANANVSHRCTDTCTKYNTNEYAQRQSSYAPA
jgi:hypothetical protein